MSLGGQAPEDRRDPARLRLHAGAVSLREYHDRIQDFLVDADVPVYLDTSALTWMIRVGSGARDELLRWFRREAMVERVLVPIWAAHELHGVLLKKGPLNDANIELGRHRKSLQGMLTDLAFQAGAERCDGADVVGFVGQVLDHLRDLSDKLSLMTKGEEWYRSAERLIVDFVNERVLAGEIFSLIDEVLPAAERRLSVRLPPGYLDADKADNRVGDVVFWKEILRDARGSGARRLILLTNDNKDDWSFAPARVSDYVGNEQGGDPVKGLQARLPHPMLVHEARSAELDDILVLSPTLLAVALDRLDRGSVKALVAATHPPRLNPAAEAGVDWGKIDPPVSQRRQRRAEREAAPAPAPDEEAVDFGTGLTDALRERAAPSPPVADLIGKLDGDATERLGAFEALTERDRLEGLSLASVVAVGRALYRAAVGDDRLAALIRQTEWDLVEPSPQLANALLLGMWAEVYFDQELQPLPAPLQGSHEALFSLAAAAPFAPATRAISSLLDEHAMRLLGRPGETAVATVRFSAKRTFDGSRKLLEQVRIGETELLCEVVPGSEDALTQVLGRSEGTAARLLGVIARRFAVSEAWLSADIEDDTPLRWPDDLGLRVLRPSNGGVIDPAERNGS